MSEFIAKVYSKIPTGLVSGKYKNGRIVKKRQGPKRTKFEFNSQDINLDIYGTTKDGKKVIGNCLIKYDINESAYLKSLNKTEENVTDLEHKFSKEINYDLSGIISEYSSDEITSDSAKSYLESQIEKKSKITFLKKGIHPYKITTKWSLSNPFFSIIENKIPEILSKVETFNNFNLESLAEENAKNVADEVMSFTMYNSSLVRKTMEEVFKRTFKRAFSDPHKKTSEYISSKEVDSIFREFQGKGLELLVNYNA